MATGVDTSALYYFFTGHEELSEIDRKTAKRMTETIQFHYRKEGLAISTTAISELANIMHRRYGSKASNEAVESLLGDERNTIVETKSSHCNEALTISKKTGVKYTDCLIAVALMGAGVLTVITADKEFARIPGIATIN